jgi:hypothetical protein
MEKLKRRKRKLLSKKEVSFHEQPEIVLLTTFIADRISVSRDSLSSPVSNASNGGIYTVS